MIEPTEAQIHAAIDEMPGSFDIISEDDNRYCNPPRRRNLDEDETYSGVRDMLRAALNIGDPEIARTAGATTLSLERRYGDVITNSHLRRLANEGFRISGGRRSATRSHFIISFDKGPL